MSVPGVEPFVDNEGQVVDEKVRDLLVGFREDLDPPEVGFGRCTVTGEWGKIISVSLPELSLDVPDLSKEVTFDPDSQNVGFSLRTAVFPMRLSVSEMGLEKLLAILRETPNVVAKVTPVLNYMWSILFRDGTTFAQFHKHPDSEEEIETRWRDVDHEAAVQYSLVPHYWEKVETLPTYTFVRESGIFYRNGIALNTGYDGVYPGPEIPCVYARRTNLVFSSEVPAGSMMRNIENSATNVVQLLGWGEGGLRGTGTRCVIAIDEEGGWRPYDYVEGAPAVS